MNYPKMNAIVWPEGFVPGYTDNYVSNEIIVTGLTADDIWPLLDTPSRWPTYYSNSADITVHDGARPGLQKGTRFFFRTFGFPIEAECTEYVAPSSEQPGRVAWHGWGGDGEDRFDVHHAWLVENLDRGRVRILTQETQNGKAAVALATTKPNPMINGHQDWLNGLVGAARGEKKL